MSAAELIASATSFDLRLLLEAGAAMPDRIGEDRTSARALLVELGIDPPA